MNKQTVIGIILIVVIFIGFQYFNKPSKEQIAERQRINDSIKNAQAEQQLAIQQQVTPTSDTTRIVASDSLREAHFGIFAKAAKGDTAQITIETELLKLRFSPKGGFVSYAELKNHKTYDKKPLVLFEGESENSFGITMQTSDNRVLTTNEVYFVPQPITKDGNGNTILTLRLQLETDSYIDFIYKIPQNSYCVDFDIAAHNMQSYFPPMTNRLDFTWNTKIRQQELGRKTENRYATLNYMYTDNDIERLKEGKNDVKSASTPTKWFAAKDHFFSTILMSKTGFATANLSSEIYSDENSKYLKNYTVHSVIDFDATGNKPTNLQLYFVPNQYKVLAGFNDGLDKAQRPNLQELIPLGWTLFRWVNKYAIIPLFNLLGSFMSSWGLIILIVTVIIKIVLLPLTFKSYMSSAKMRVLKPQVDAINERIPADKMMERQQAQMSLYRSVGVSPMGGCLPMILQMPILVAVFMYLPSAFELRQQSFLWATDLSTFDTLPFLTWNTAIPFIGKHISLFCLLMTITNVIYTKVNMAATAGSNQQMAMMKWMMYLMPLMFFFIFNEYASGLTYYYFVSLLLTVLQTYLFRLFVNDQKLLQQLELAKQTKKPAKKSGFMARLEEAQKMQQKRLREQQNARRKR